MPLSSSPVSAAPRCSALASFPKNGKKIALPKGYPPTSAGGCAPKSRGKQAKTSQEPKKKKTKIMRISGRA